MQCACLACQRLLQAPLDAHAGRLKSLAQNTIGPGPAGTGEDRCVQRTLISAIRDLEAGPAPGGAGLESGSGSSASPPQSGSSASAPAPLGAPALAAPLPAAPASIRLAPLPGPEPGLGPRLGFELGLHQASASAPALASLGPSGRAADALGADADGVVAPDTNPGATLAYRGGFFASLPDLRAEAEPPGPQPRPPPLPPTAHLLGGASGGLGPTVAAGGVPGSADPLPLPSMPTIGGLVEPGAAAAAAAAAAACEDGCAPSSIALRTLNTQVWLVLLAYVMTAPRT